MSNVPALRSTFDGDPAEFEAALRTLRGDLADLSADLAGRTDSFSALGTSLSPADSRSGDPAVIISGPIAIYGVQDVESLYDQLNAEARRRNV